MSYLVGVALFLAGVLVGVYMPVCVIVAVLPPKALRKIADYIRRKINEKEGKK